MTIHINAIICGWSTKSKSLNFIAEFTWNSIFRILIPYFFTNVYLFFCFHIPTYLNYIFLSKNLTYLKQVVTASLKCFTMTSTRIDDTISCWQTNWSHWTIGRCSRGTATTVHDESGTVEKFRRCLVMIFWQYHRIHPHWWHAFEVAGV